MAFSIGLVGSCALHFYSKYVEINNVMEDQNQEISAEEEHVCDGTCVHETEAEESIDKEQVIQMLENLVKQSEATIEGLNRRNESLTKAFQELRNEYDLSNNRHRKALEDSTKYACTDFAKILITAMDSFSMAMELTRSMPTVYLGLKMTYDTLEQELKRHGIIKMYCELGTTPNPNLHQVIGEVESNEFQTGTIAQVVQNGYIIHDRILRHATVNVVKGSK